MLFVHEGIEGRLCILLIYCFNFPFTIIASSLLISILSTNWIIAIIYYKTTNCWYEWLLFIEVLNLLISGIFLLNTFDNISPICSISHIYLLHRPGIYKIFDWSICHTFPIIKVLLTCLFPQILFLSFVLSICL